MLFFWLGLNSICSRFKIRLRSGAGDSDCRDGFGPFCSCLLCCGLFRRSGYFGEPRWGLREWEEVSALMNPALIYGTTALADVARDGIQPLPQGSIYIATGGSSGGVKFARHRWETLSAAWRGLRGLYWAWPV